VTVTKKNGNQIVSAGAYATAADFKQIFTEDVISVGPGLWSGQSGKELVLAKAFSAF
jgi:hypothetical protein